MGFGGQGFNGGGGGPPSTVVNNLVSTSTTDALAANQGRVLDLIKISHHQVADIASRDALTTLKKGDLIYVADATADTDVGINTWAMYFVLADTPSVTYERIADGLSHEQSQTHLPSGPVGATDVANPTLGEIQTYVTAQGIKNTMGLYTGDGVATSVPTHVYHIDNLGNAELVYSPPGDGAVQVFTWKPGSGLNGPATFDLLADLTAQLAIERTSGNSSFEVIIDDTAGSTSTVPGTYDFEGVRRLSAISNLVNSTGFAEMTITEGTVFQNGPFVYDDVRIINSATATPVIQAGNGATFRFEGAAEVSNFGAAAFIDAQALGPGSFVVAEFYERSGWGFAGSEEVIDLGANALLLLRLYGGNLNDTTIRNGTGVFVENYQNSNYSDNQPAMGGAFSDAFGFQSVRYNYTTAPVTTDSGIQTQENVRVCDTTAGSVKISLFQINTGAFTSKGYPVQIVEVSGVNSFEVEANGTDTINGQTGPVTIPAGGQCCLINDGVSNWVFLYKSEEVPEIIPTSDTYLELSQWVHTLSGGGPNSGLEPVEEIVEGYATTKLEDADNGAWFWMESTENLASTNTQYVKFRFIKKPNGSFTFGLRQITTAGQTDAIVDTETGDLLTNITAGENAPTLVDKIITEHTIQVILKYESANATTSWQLYPVFTSQGSTTPGFANIGSLNIIDMDMDYPYVAATAGVSAPAYSVSTSNTAFNTTTTQAGVTILSYEGTASLITVTITDDLFFEAGKANQMIIYNNQSGAGITPISIADGLTGTLSCDLKQALLATPPWTLESGHYCVITFDPSGQNATLSFPLTIEQSDTINNATSSSMIKFGRYDGTGVFGLTSNEKWQLGGLVADVEASKVATDADLTFSGLNEAHRLRYVTSAAQIVKNPGFTSSDKFRFMRLEIVNDNTVNAVTSFESEFTDVDGTTAMSNVTVTAGRSTELFFTLEQDNTGGTNPVWRLLFARNTAAATGDFQAISDGESVDKTAREVHFGSSSAGTVTMVKTTDVPIGTHIRFKREGAGNLIINGDGENIAGSASFDFDANDLPEGAEVTFQRTFSSWVLDETHHHELFIQRPVDTSGGAEAFVLPTAVFPATDRVFLYTNIDVTNTAELSVEWNLDTLNGVVDGTFLFSNYPAGTQFMVSEIAGGWTVAVIGAAEQSDLFYEDKVGSGASQAPAAAWAQLLDFSIDIPYAGTWEVSFDIGTNGVVTGGGQSGSPVARIWDVTDGVIIPGSLTYLTKVHRSFNGSVGNVTTRGCSSKTVIIETTGPKTVRVDIAGSNAGSFTVLAAQSTFNVKELPTTQAVLAGMVVPASLASYFCAIETDQTDWDSNGDLVNWGATKAHERNSGGFLTSVDTITTPNKDMALARVELGIDIWNNDNDAVSNILLVNGVAQVVRSTANAINTEVTTPLNIVWEGPLPANSTIQLQLGSVNSSDSTLRNATAIIRELPSSTVTAITPGDTLVDDQSSSGYIDIGNTRMQWAGNVATSTTSGTAITFPMPFADTAYSIVTQRTINQNDRDIRITSKSTTGCVIVTSNDSGSSLAASVVDWQAIGVKP